LLPAVSKLVPGEVDDSLLEALEDYVKRQRSASKDEAANEGGLH
jgi:hypothetical protein